MQTHPNENIHSHIKRHIVNKTYFLELVYAVHIRRKFRMKKSAIFLFDE